MRLTNFCFIFDPVMGSVRNTFIKLLFVLISFFFIDGGKTLLLAGNNIQILLNPNQDGDLEIPHQHILNKYDDDEKGMKSNSIDFLCSITKPAIIHFYLIMRTEDFALSIWQPPKTL